MPAAVRGGSQARARPPSKAPPKAPRRAAPARAPATAELHGLSAKWTLIAAAADRNPDKWGSETIATKIPIISEEDSRAAKPDYYLALPWHFLDEFIERESEFLARGGQFIVPLPEVRLVGAP